MKFRLAILGVMLGGSALAQGPAQLAPPSKEPAQIPAYVSQAVAASERPAADTARDADRKPAQMIAFAGIKPGDKVADLMPGGGYFTRIFAKVVGPRGRVYAVVPGAALARNPNAAEGVKRIAADPAYKNVSVVVGPFETMAEPGTLDVAWTSQNYHDLYNNSPAVAAAFDAAVFKALKPGGLFIVSDHSAAASTDAGAAKPLHRIDREVVKAQVIEAGFVLDAESQLLANPADEYIKTVTDPTLRGHTDQFLFRFRKPR